MALIRSFTDQFGDTYQNAYWRIEFISVDKKLKVAQIIMRCYENEEKKGKYPLCEMFFSVNVQQFDLFFSADELDPEGKNPWESAYRFVQSQETFSHALQV